MICEPLPLTVPPFTIVSWPLAVPCDRFYVSYTSVSKGVRGTFCLVHLALSLFLALRPPCLQPCGSQEKHLFRTWPPLNVLRWTASQTTGSRSWKSLRLALGRLSLSPGSSLGEGGLAAVAAAFLAVDKVSVQEWQSWERQRRHPALPESWLLNLSSWREPPPHTSSGPCASN